MEECIIEEKFLKGQAITFYDRRIAYLKGQGDLQEVKNVRYRNIKTNEEYLALCLGFGWSGERPGFSLVLAAQENKKDKNKPIFKVLEETEKKDIFDLLHQANGLRKKYGQNCLEIPFFCYGDPFHTDNKFIEKFNDRLRTAGKKEFFYLTTQAIHSADAKEPDRFQFFCDMIYHLGKAGRIKLKPHPRISAYLDLLGDDRVAKATPLQFPAVFALGSALLALHFYKPYLEGIDPPGKTFPTDFDAYYRQEKLRENRYYGIDDYGDDDGPIEPTEGDPSPTILGDGQ